MGLALSHTGLTRQSAFSYACNRCLTCCRAKKIQLNPYEIARLARNRAMSTSIFIERYTVCGGTFLKFDAEDTCVFLNAEGCAVHTDRPLVCRLYPLGRQVHCSGRESFDQIAPEAGCRGILGQAGTIADYLEYQGARPFMQAADLYLTVLWELLDRLSRDDNLITAKEMAYNTIRSFGGPAAEGHPWWLDMDRAVADYCRATGSPVPEDIWQKTLIHIEAVQKWTS